MRRVATIVPLVLAAGVAGSSCASEPCAPATEDAPELCPLDLPAIASVRIDHVAVRSTSTVPDPTDCGGFRPDESAVRRYFSKARAVDAAGFHQLDWSPCSADGEMTLADGRRLRWMINLSRAGSLGATAGATTLRNVDCPDCDFAPFTRK